MPPVAPVPPVEDASAADPPLAAAPSPDPPVAAVPYGLKLEPPEPQATAALHAAGSANAVM
jgi:hypothetical protein